MSEPMVDLHKAKNNGLTRLGLATCLGAALLATGGCSFFDKKKEQPSCPRVSVLGDAATETRFREGNGRDITDVVLEAEFVSYKGSCAYDWDKQVMNVTMQIGIDAKLGPAAQGRKADIGYFVAVPTFYPAPQAKLVAPVALTFPENTDRVRYVDEEVQLNIPIKELKDLARYEVFVGLQLTPDEVEYNRKQKGEK